MPRRTIGASPAPSGAGAAAPAGRGYLPIVEVWRGDTVESLHFGALAVVDSSGRDVAAFGDPGTVTFLRSAAKPIQVLPLLAAGAVERFGFTEREVAVMIGSHGGEPFHVEAVGAILARIGLDEGALQCGAHSPHYAPAARELRRAGTPPSAVHNNCSGKHAGMLALAVHLGAPVASYLDPEHPVQIRIREAIEAFSGLPAAAIRIGTDGCSAPNFALPIGRAALLYARLIDPDPSLGLLAGSARRAVAAMRAHPDMVAGTGRLCTELMRSGRAGLIAKIGAEGFYGLACRLQGRGVGIALKISDGEGKRSRFSVTIETLRQLGILEDAAAAELRERFVGPLRNHRGIRVGRIETIFRLKV